MLNLRQLGDSEPSANSDAQHFSRFSAPNFKVPSNFLGNIGEPLDHGQAERYVHDGCEISNVLDRLHNVSGCESSLAEVHIAATGLSQVQDNQDYDSK